MLFPWRNHEVSIIFLRHELKFYMDYDAEGGGRVLLKRNDVEVVYLLQKMGNTRERTITLDVEMEDYHRRFANTSGRRRIDTFYRKREKVV